MKEKSVLRDEMKKKLGGMDRSSHAAKSKDIHDKLFASKEWQHAQAIGVTISRFPEVDTEAIIMRAWEEEKRVAVPKCYPSTKSMEFYFLENLNQLESVYFGLKEPIVKEVELCPKDKLELVLVPGLIFDEEGYRIGFGGGYYDRYLVGYTGSKVSLAFSQQLVKKVPTDYYDIPVHKIVTNEVVYDCTIRK
ncbi:5-formyltetrahydrofolate cyclo-ligase [Sutcliffiella horikoshii]|uniref:5-formyltetrahydrofolate cyclo-ligase n=1 Tax=Sutcliffiella horikoshii TaxID=79883 RepID=A0A1Y0CQL0_9BACI|nr:5-formyltetrahydrofolate cyclo-ligase [Sutcliffiella horikoshii]ART77266.1 5-formyltetrahydrofolate cyclo-ligase [Sutcliffiella horikoshii]TYS74197.1 5-formyltetrahydrofolate cyclo-ligase [Sutcliffiella horikoshii]